MNDTYSHIKKSWVKRSLKYQDKMEGILPKSFPKLVNKFLDDWMFQEISKSIKNNKKTVILDMGCGYGRLSKSVLYKFPNSNVFGIDISDKYVELFNKSLNPRGIAKVGDIRNLPFEDSSMDLVFVVTSLMYVVDAKNQKQVFNEIFRVLKNNGKFVLIERHPIGYKLVTLGGLIDKIRGKKNKEITAVSYTKKLIKHLIGESGFLEECRGIPFFTLFLPLFFIVNIFSKSLLSKLLNIIWKLDKMFGKLLTPSLYISYTGRKV